MAGRGDYGMRGPGRLVTAAPAEEVEGVLMSPVSGPGCMTDPPTSVAVTVYLRDRETDRLEQTSQTVTVKVSDPDIDAPAGAYCRSKMIGGMRQFTWLSCSDSLDDCSGSSGS